MNGFEDRASEGESPLDILISEVVSGGSDILAEQLL
jgi:hypothetical protein